MNWFKRLCMFVFGVAGLLALVALCLTWVGPWTTQARSMLELRWYFLALEVLVCIAAVGLLACLLVSLFYPRNPKETIVAEVSGGTITVTRAAIVSQARNIVEDDGSCIASTVHVRMRKRGRIRVALRVTPKRPVNVVERGEVLYAELEKGLAQTCGNSVKSISLVFNEPEQQGPIATHVEAEPPAAEDSRVTTPLSQPITVPVSSLATPAAPDPDPLVPGMGDAAAETPALADEAADLGEDSAAGMSPAPDEAGTQELGERSEEAEEA